MNSMAKQYEEVMGLYKVGYCPDCDAKRFIQEDCCEVCGSNLIVETISDYEDDRD